MKLAPLSILSQHGIPRVLAVGWQAAAVLAGGIGLSLYFSGDSYLQTVISMAAVLSVGVVGLNFAMGNAGLFSMAHGAFMAVGAYSSAVLTRQGAEPLLALVAGLALAVLLALAFGSLTLRLGELYFVLATLALVAIAFRVVVAWEPVTRGTNGLGNVARLGLGDWRLTTNASVAVAAVVITAVLVLVASMVLASRLGREFRAVREDPLAASTCGIPVTLVRAQAFVLHAGYSALAGSLFAHVYRFVSPTSFSLDASIFAIAMLVIGGSGSVIGGVIGVVVLTSASEALRFGQEYRQLFYGVTITAVAILAPEGLSSFIANLWSQAQRAESVRRWLPRRSGAGRGPQVSAMATPMGFGPNRSVEEGLLVVEGVRKRFGGVQAVQGVSLSVRTGSIQALIGPNGSGKSTLINLVSGVNRLDSGRVLLDGVDTSRMPAHEISAMGLVRTYQSGRLFRALSVRENVAIAADHRRSVRGPLGRLGPQGGVAWVDWVLEVTQISHLQGIRAGQLGFGNQRLLELARSLAIDPRFILLDEPAAGLTLVERERLSELLSELRSLGLGILLVEHDMSVVMTLADTVTVLDFGKMIASGTAAEVQASQQVLEVYLGS